jgi:F-type H+-transporting ATPase subunit delta
VSDVIARRYAQAMAEVAESEGAIDTVGRDLERFAALMSADGGALGEALASPVFTSDERRAVLEQLLPRLGLHPLTANLLHVVNDKRRFPLMSAISTAFRDLADERAHRTRISVQTAAPLTADLEREVREAFERVTRKQVILTTEVRPELIGGLVAKVGDTVYDSSIRTRLEQMKQALLAAPVAQA